MTTTLTHTEKVWAAIRAEAQTTEVIFTERVQERTGFTLDQIHGAYRELKTLGKIRVRTIDGSWVELA